MLVTYIAFAVLVISAGAYYALHLYRQKINPLKKVTDKIKSKDGETETKEVILSPVLARIYDRTSRTIYNKMIEGVLQTNVIKEYPEIGLGRQWNKDGKWVYAMCREFENTYIPIEKYLVMDRKNPPSKLHGYLQQPELEITHDVHEDKGFMEQYGKYMPYVLAILFLVFMVVMNKQ